jgi:hypothetical protein
MKMSKPLLEKSDFYIQFTDEELKEIGWEKGQKLSCTYDEKNNSIFLKPYVKVEIDMSSWDRELLEFLIGESCDKDISCNQVIEDLLVQSLNIKDKKTSSTELLCE